MCWSHTDHENVMNAQYHNMCLNISHTPTHDQTTSHLLGLVFSCCLLEDLWSFEMSIMGPGLFVHQLRPHNMVQVYRIFRGGGVDKKMKRELALHALSKA